MWTLNVRGGDTDYCPISEGYLLIDDQNCRFFVDERKLNAQVRAQLDSEAVHIHDYSHLNTALNLINQGAKLIYTAKNSASLLIHQVKADIELIDKPCPVTLMKAQKNPSELGSLEETLRQDGAAVVKFMKWLDEQVPSGNVTELNAEATLMSYRQQIEGYIGDSFRTIAGYAEHGAKMHYAANEQSNYPVEESHFFLVDSGGQYPGVNNRYYSYLPFRYPFRSGKT